VVKNGVQLCTKEAGTVLGEMSFLGRALATADVAVDCDGLQVFQMSEEYLNDVFQNQSRLCSKFYWNLAKQLAELLVSCDTPTFTVQASVCVSVSRSLALSFVRLGHRNDTCWLCQAQETDEQSPPTPTSGLTLIRVYISAQSQEFRTFPWSEGDTFGDLSARITKKLRIAPREFYYRTRTSRHTRTW